MSSVAILLATKPVLRCLPRFAVPRRVRMYKSRGHSEYKRASFSFEIPMGLRYQNEVTDQKVKFEDDGATNAAREDRPKISLDRHSFTRFGDKFFNMLLHHTKSHS